jgi:phosphoribosylanthranilate isomerase
MFAKICGITRLDDAMHAVEHGATALGFVFWEHSPRYVAPDTVKAILGAMPRGVVSVGVFVNAPIDTLLRTVAASGVTMVQLHGDETPALAAAAGVPVLRATGLETVTVEAAQWPDDTVWVLDAHDPIRRGGTGRRIDWAAAAAVARERRVVLAGGLTPENVAEAIATVRPIGVDVSSGVEASPGVKDPQRVTEFLANARAAFAERFRRVE